MWPLRQKTIHVTVIDENLWFCGHIEANLRPCPQGVSPPGGGEDQGGQSKVCANADIKFWKRAKTRSFHEFVLLHRDFYLPHLISKPWMEMKKEMVKSCHIFGILLLRGEWEKRFTSNVESLSRGDAASILSLSDKFWRLLKAGNTIPPADSAATGNNINPCLRMVFSDCSLHYLRWLQSHSSRPPQS